MSVSGKDKGQLAPEDFLPLNPAGQLVEEEPGFRKPSAETLLHAMIYRLYPQAGVVLHIHSVDATVISKLYERDGLIRFRDFEMLKAFPGVTTHEAEVSLPVFPNAQDMQALSRDIEIHLQNQDVPGYGFLLAGHGLYAWGDSIADARRHVEAYEFLMSCNLRLKSHGYPVYSG